MNASRAFPVEEASQVAEPRRVAQWLASRLGFSEERVGRAALIATELATNLAKHARHGEILIQPLTTGDGTPDGLEIVSVDKGPGMPDASRSRRDGYSTSGTLGHGLGAVERQADGVELFTHTTGTVIVARLWRDRPPGAAKLLRYDVGAVHVSKTGESVCGDAWSWRQRHERLAIIVADGLGHGLSAHDAAQAAVDVFARSPENPPGRLLEDAHAALRSTRGAAIAVVAIDLERGTAVYAGLGNIAGAIVVGGGKRHNLVSHNGTAGHTASRVQEFTYPVPRGAILVLASDGLGTRWNIEDYPGLSCRAPGVIAAVLYRDHCRRRDDVTVVVAKERSAITETV